MHRVRLKRPGETGSMIIGKREKGRELPRYVRAFVPGHKENRLRPDRPPLTPIVELATRL